MPFVFLDEQKSTPSGFVFEDADATPATPVKQTKQERSWAQVAGDTGVDAAKGIVGLGESAVGLADLATGNLAGKGLAAVGYDPARTNQILSDLYSDPRQQANRNVSDAKGFVDTTKALIQNPSVIVGGVVESAPMMLGSVGAVRALAAKMLAGAGLTAGTAEAAAFLSNPAVAAKLTLAGSAAEGAMTAGGIQEQGRQAGRDYTDTAPAALAGGALTGAIGVLSSKVPGFKDAEVGMATAGMGGAQRQGLLATGKEIAKGTFKEGVLEEMPQSAQEQVFTNLALGKPWNEGVPEAAAQGIVVGAAQGGGMNVYSAGRNALAAPPVNPTTPPETPSNPATPPAEPAHTAIEPIAKAPDTSAAEVALLAPVALTSLDRVNEIDTELAPVRQRLAELASQEGGSASDQALLDATAQAADLENERAELTKGWPKAVPGTESSFTTEAGARVNAQYALMDAGDLITSHDEGLRKNPLYPPELQPRERDRAASEMQVSGIVQKLDPARLGLSADAANGAPIVGADGLVESGNARTIALKRVYQANGQKAADYKQWLIDNAAQFGVTPESVNTMAKPVLVRVRTTPVNRAEFARQANASTVAMMSPSEQAKSDANRIDTMEDLTPDDNGDFSNAASRPFVRRFMARLPMTEQAGMIDSSGNLSTSGYARVRNAVLAKAYGDSPVLARMTESMDDNLRNVSKALMLAAPKVAQMRQAIKSGDRFDADITPDLMASVEELSKIKDDGGSVQDALAQTDIMGDQRTPEARQLLQFLNDNMRRPRRMADFIVAYMDALDAMGDPRQESMFGDTQAPAKADLLTAAEKATQNEVQDSGPKGESASPKAGAQDGRKPKDAQGSGGGAQTNGVGNGSSQNTDTKGQPDAEVSKLADAAARDLKNSWPEGQQRTEQAVNSPHPLTAEAANPAADSPDTRPVAPSVPTAEPESNPVTPPDATEDRVVNEPTASYNEPYEADLFGNPIPVATGSRGNRGGKSTKSGGVQPATALQGDAAAPAGEYHVRTIVGAETTRKLGASRITNSFELAQATAYLYRSAVERFDGIVTDKDGKPLGVIGGFKGALSQASVYPGTLVGEAVRIPGASKVWFSHNHPSGSSVLSNADLNLAKVLGEVFRGSGVEPMGLLAVSGNKFSFTSDGLGLQSHQESFESPTQETAVPVVEREQIPPRSPLQVIGGPDEAKRVAAAYYKQSKTPGIILLNSQNHISAWVPLAPNMLGKLRHTGGLNAIYRAVSESNAGAAIIVHGGELDGDVGGVKSYQNIASALAKIDVRPLDAIYVSDTIVASTAEQGLDVAKGPVLSRGSGGGMDVKVLEGLAARIKARMPNMPKVHVLASPADKATPKALRDYIEKQGAFDDVEGAMHDGKLYLFASGLTDALRAEHVLAEHEAAHFGLRAILGDSLKAAMRAIYNNNAAVRQAATELQKRGKLSNAEATEEVIVDIPSSQLVKLHGWRKVVLQARDWLAGHGFDAMASKLSGWLDGSLSDQQRADLMVANLVLAARAYMAGKRGARASIRQDTMLSGTMAEDAAKQEKWLSTEARARGYADIDELAEKNYPLFEKLAELWRKKNPAENGVLLSRAPLQGTAAERADKIIQTKAATAKPIDDAPTPDTRLSRSGLEQDPAPVAPKDASPLQKAKATALSLTSPQALDQLMYDFTDKYIDLKRIRDHIKAIGGTITDLNDAYLGEELYHKRLSKRIEDFLSDEVKPLLADLRARGIGAEEFEQFLHARHAPEANKAMAARNPTQAEIDEGKASAEAVVKALEEQLQGAVARGAATNAIEQSLTLAREEGYKWVGAQAFQGTEEERLSLSGMSAAQAQAVMDGLSPAKLKNMQALAARVDAINAKTMDTLGQYGLMDQESLEQWRKAYQFYIPLHRDEAHPDSTSHPIGQGFSVKGDASKHRTGSNAKVTNILGHIAMQREAALTRGEKNTVVKKLYVMAAQNPDSELWDIEKIPTITQVDNKTGFVRTYPDPTYKNKPNVVMVRIAGRDAAIVFNEHNPQGVRLAGAMKNMDVGDLGAVLTQTARVTRWFAAVNTQYNPVFGLMNFARDIQAAMLNLSTTPLAGQQAKVAKGVPAALRAVYRVERGKTPANAEGAKWAKLWEDLQDAGGTTGYRDLYPDAKERTQALVNDLQKLDRGQVSQAAHAVVDWLSDYNDAIENGVRLSAYSAALDQGMSRERAASLAKNLTVNFNRKGAKARDIGALYAFFNAAIQGNARMFETLRGPVGKKIMFGGVALGMITSMLGMAVMGGGDGEDDEWEKVPEFVKERAIVIPMGHKDYMAIPMPLGFHVFPNLGRVMAEWAMGGPDKSLGKQVGKILGTLVDSFNPVGGGSDIGQVIMPTVLDPFLALWRNKDWTGRQIYREDSNSLDPTPGFTRAKDSASTPSKLLSEAINKISGGNEYRPGLYSPTPDQIDYVIGQVTGGLGREILKVEQVLTTPFTGDELPAHKIPVIGRIYGNTRGAGAQSGAFYENVRTLNEVENEVKGRNKNDDDADGYMAREPLTNLIGDGNSQEKIVRHLRKQRKQEMRDQEPGYKDRVKEINAQIEEEMRVLNRAVSRVKLGLETSE